MCEVAHRLICCGEGFLATFALATTRATGFFSCMAATIKAAGSEGLRSSHRSGTGSYQSSIAVFYTKGHYALL